MFSLRIGHIDLESHVKHQRNLEFHVKHKRHLESHIKHQRDLESHVKHQRDHMITVTVVLLQSLYFERKKHLTRISPLQVIVIKTAL